MQLKNSQMRGTRQANSFSTQRWDGNQSKKLHIVKNLIYVGTRLLQVFYTEINKGGKDFQHFETLDM